MQQHGFVREFLGTEQSEESEIQKGIRRGWLFTTCEGKEPRRRNWNTEPPLNEAALASYADHGGNVALRTGKDSGVVVLDIDPAHGGENPPNLPDTPCVRTGGGGLHFYFKYPANGNIPNSSGKIAKGVDVRGDGGAAVFVGSKHPDTGATYEWIKSPDDVPLADFPSHLLLKTSDARTNTELETKRISNSAYGDAALRDECEKVRKAQNGTRNDTLNRAAFSLGTLRDHLVSEVAEASLLEAAIEVGLPEEEAKKTIRSGLKSGQEQPRALTKSAEQTTKNANDSAPKKVTRVNLAAVEAERVDWIWPGRLPCGKLVVLDGDPGVGKSTLTLDIAAHISTGRPFSYDKSPVKVADVVILTAEDGLADTIRPRLDAAGADVSRIHALTEIIDENDCPKPLVLPRDLAEIEAAINETKAGLLIIDPLSAFLDQSINSHKDQDVRKALYALAVMAERTNVCVLIVRHLNKVTGGNPIYRGGGSIGIIGAARVGLVAAKHPEFPEKRVLAISKSNLAREADALEYELRSDEKNGCARIAWTGKSSMQAHDLLNAPSKPREREEAATFLKRRLASGPALQSVIVAEAQGLGISDRTLQRAKKQLNVKSKKRDDGWEWTLPNEQADLPF